MHCLITGASRGIGLATAHKLAGLGHSITLCSRSPDLLRERQAELPTVAKGQEHHVWSLDMADLAAVEQFSGAPLPPASYDVFVNSAGVAGVGLLSLHSVRSIDATLKVNLHAPILLAKVLSRAMLRKHKQKKESGSNQLSHLLFVSSALAKHGWPGSSVYSATKAGLEGFTRSLARELGSRRIAVNCVSPGLVDTDMGRAASQDLLAANSFPGMVSPEAVAETIAFVLQSRNITGASIPVDNGLTA